MLGEVGLFNETVRPQGLHQLILFHHPFPILDKQKKRLEGFWLKRHDLIIAKQKALRGIDAERSKLVEAFHLRDLLAR